jgi:hypothetical protein
VQDLNTVYSIRKGTDQFVQVKQRSEEKRKKIAKAVEENNKSIPKTKKERYHHSSNDLYSNLQKTDIIIDETVSVD